MKPDRKPRTPRPRLNIKPPVGDLPDPRTWAPEAQQAFLRILGLPLPDRPAAPAPVLQAP